MVESKVNATHFHTIMLAKYQRWAGISSMPGSIKIRILGNGREKVLLWNLTKMSVYNLSAMFQSTGRHKAFSNKTL